MRGFISLISFAQLAFALSADYFTWNPGFTFEPASSWFSVSTTGASGCSAVVPAQWLFNGDGSFTFVSPQPSESFKWWGWQFPTGTGGLASVCFDGATGSACHRVSNVNASAAPGPVVLFSASGLPNIAHTVTITDLPDPSQGGAENFLTVDHISLDFHNPTFPEGTTITSIPLKPVSDTPYYQASVTVGKASHLMYGPVVRKNLCTSHSAQYTPSDGPGFYNFSIVDTAAFGDGTTSYQSWRVNDTFHFGNVATAVTFGASFAIDPDFNSVDGNFGLAKGWFVAQQCETYPNFVEAAYVNGVISNPVIAFYQLNSFDQVASGVSPVVQIGGIDKNKYTGAIDWIPMTQDSWFITPGVTHSFHASKTSPSTPIHFFQQRIIFDTGDPNFGGMPENDWNLLVNAIGAEYNEDSGDWWFPCESKLEIDLHGSEGVVYGINLSDPDTLDPNTGLCAATLYSMGPGADNWIMGTPFFSKYYLIFHYEANLMGLATKNLGASAAKESALIGSS